MSGPVETPPPGEPPPLAGGEAPTLALPEGLAAPTQVGAPPPALLAAAAGPAPPRVIDGRYELLATLGAGGMGVVWRARDREAGREVALKLLRADSRDLDALERFRREGEATAALDHPGIVRVHAAGVAGEQAWLVYELVEGARTLAEALPGLDLRRRVELLRDVARALAHAHAQGIVHRDVKPENALLDPAGRVRVADFGLALLPGRERLTQSGALMGTPSYMAPEQASGERARIGPPTDVWSLGVMLYEALTGALPYQAPTLVMLIARITRGPPAAPGKVLADVPPDLEAVCMRALAQEPGDRHPHAGAFADDLQAWLDGRPLAPAPPRRARRSPLRWALTLALVPPLFALRAWLTAPEEYPPDQWPRPRDPARLLGPVPAAAPPAPEVAALTSAPEWVRALPEAARPPLPLPAGLAFGRARGEYLNEADGSLLVWIPPGELLMGAAPGDPEAEEDERPGRRVRLSRGLFLGKHEVSWAHYRRFCFATGRALPLPVIEDHPGRFEAQDDHPVFHVTWQDAADYCQRFGLRLPSEAEWERGARGDDQRVYPWGSAPPQPGAPPTCNVADEATRRAAPSWRTTAGYDDQEAYLGRVGAFPEGASPFGCHDMAGNLWEWVADWYAPYDPALLLDPPGPASGEERAIRGGSWCFPLADGRASNRNSARPELRYDYVGFRVAR